ncbi:MAG: hypothetical protein IK134_11200 [Oscillospiraceae bacterium]|nr:hypothetical protein [Oscillospiraceae bacterium]
MKNLRVWIAAGLLCAIVLLSCFSAAAVRKSCTLLIAQTEAVLTADDPAAAIEALTEEWHRQSVLLHLFVPNQPLTELNTAILRLDALYAVQSDALPAELHGIAAALKWIRGRELTAF